MKQEYNALIMTTAKDYLRLQNNYYKLVENMPAGKLLFIGSEEVGELVKAANMGERVGFINENDVLPFSAVHEVMTEQMQPLLQGRELPRGVTGWYYQQFLKMQYANICEDEYYLVWDGDTIPCAPFTMFREDIDVPYLDLKREYHEEYFITLTKLLPGMRKCIEKSFIAEHMLMKCDIMKQLIADIESNQEIPGTRFWEKIIRAIDADKIQDGSFSEFETYGTYVCFKYQNAYRLRDWHSFRLGGEFFDPDTISDADYEWLSRDFYAISFEKGHSVREDHKNLFDNKKYQEKLSARQMLELAQQEFKEGYLEIWDEPTELPEQRNGNSVGQNVTIPQADNQGEYALYEFLGDFYLSRNKNQAYLCYENAEFLCTDEMRKSILKTKKEQLQLSGEASVRKTTFVIVSYNSIYLMQKCLESIREHCAPGSYTVIIVDNASTDGVAEWLEQQPDIMLVLCDENAGFPMGCNIGIQYAAPEEDIFLLNNDTRMTHNALFWLRMGLYENEHIGATGCIANYCGIEQLEDVVFSLPGEYLEYAKKKNVPCINPYEEKTRLSGFAMLIKRSVLDEVGDLDETFSPGYFEDDDLSLRIHKAGYRLLICHNSFIYHAGSQSFIKRDDLEDIFTRNYNYLVRKWGYDSWVYSALQDVEKELFNQISHNQNDFFRVLEVGAGSGNALTKLKYMYPNAQVYGVEENMQAVENSVETVPILCLDWRKDKLPFVEQFFDYIIYNDRRSRGKSKEEIAQCVGKYLKADGKLLFTF